MKVRAEQVTDAANEKVKRAARAIVRVVAQNTPVDTGEARSNWVISLVLPSSERIPAHFAHPRGSQGGGRGTAEKANLGETIALADQIIRTRKYGQDVWLSNNAPHIGLLNDGSSEQAPAGFIEAGIDAAVRATRTVRMFK